uniref:Uncharacterized protein n=1 Tax=Arundo donax TaxID=35708 RepID=A0A0A8ZIK5_ARUDO
MTSSCVFVLSLSPCVLSL